MGFLSFKILPKTILGLLVKTIDLAMLDENTYSAQLGEFTRFCDFCPDEAFAKASRRITGLLATKFTAN